VSAFELTGPEAHMPTSSSRLDVPRLMPSKPSRWSRWRTMPVRAASPVDVLRVACPRPNLGLARAGGGDRS